MTKSGTQMTMCTGGVLGSCFVQFQFESKLGSFWRLCIYSDQWSLSCPAVAIRGPDSFLSTSASTVACEFNVHNSVISFACMNLWAYLAIEEACNLRLAARGSSPQARHVWLLIVGSCCCSNTHPVAMILSYVDSRKYLYHHRYQWCLMTSS